MDKERLGNPLELDAARVVAHAACQLLYRAATANNTPLPGDEHSNLGWDVTSGCFQTRTLGETGTVVSLGLSPLALQIGDEALALDGVAVTAALTWLDEKLDALDLQPASAVETAYDLPADVAALETFAAVEGLDGLVAWYDLAADALTQLAVDMADLKPGPSDVRCWPHHFDIATYVSLEDGDAEVARGIGAGLSPGDGSYGEPYFYINPWPHIAQETLPSPIKPGHWHTKGFIGSVATATEIITLEDVSAGARNFVRQSFDTGRSLLGI
ncbi:MAG: hypothetical protein AAFR27_01900 [Pseudomonadota bacterium]